MAKITARGDRALSIYIKPNGARVCVTYTGRLLAQLLKGDSYKYVGRIGHSDLNELLTKSRTIVEARYPGARLR